MGVVGYPRVEFGGADAGVVIDLRPAGEKPQAQLDPFPVGVVVGLRLPRLREEFRARTAFDGDLVWFGRGAVVAGEAGPSRPRQTSGRDH
ncbi:hypothetical protein ALI144C_27375 [Actinosynnema sp. ALI-1.44]|nr:hypothetical protein ALI144C_27375 [Actinosynnema sp. ALI-1.44]